MKKTGLAIAFLMSGMMCTIATAAMNSPEALVKVIADAATIKNYKSLESLCLPKSDALSKSVCTMSQQNKSIQDIFSQGYSTVKVDGEAVVEGDKAEVPVSGIGSEDNQQKATLLLEKEGDSWYLVGIQSQELEALKIDRCYGSAVRVMFSVTEQFGLGRFGYDAEMSNYISAVVYELAAPDIRSTRPLFSFQGSERL